MAYAFAVPIPSGKTEAVRRLTEECLGARKSEYDDMQRRSGVTEESYCAVERAQRTAGQRARVASVPGQS